jgi:hypothetical protein
MRRAPKEFDKTIHYYEPWIDDKRYKVAIKMCTDDGTDVKFYTEHFKDDKDKIISNSFDKLSDLYDWIEDQLATMPDVKWAPKIYIRVIGESKGRVDGTDGFHSISLLASKVEIYADAVEIGTAPDGRCWTRCPGKPKSKRIFDKNIGYGFEKEKYYWKKDDPNDPGEPYSRALIDDTPENRELLVQFSVRFDQLRDQFFRAFAPEYVSRFLAQTAGMLLLSGSFNDNSSVQEGK